VSGQIVAYEDFHVLRWQGFDVAQEDLFIEEVIDR
jgi:hypothetical protein